MKADTLTFDVHSPDWENRYYTGVLSSMTVPYMGFIYVGQSTTAEGAKKKMIVSLKRLLKELEKDA